MDKKPGLSLREVVLFGVLGALTFALQVVMGPLPNIEPVSLLVLLYGAVFGWKCLYPVYVFVVMEILFYGLGLWNINYLYIWAVPALAGVALRKMDGALVWALVSGVFGLAFGALCALTHWVTGGWAYALGWWVEGIPYDLLHCGGNFVMALLLFKPLRALLERLLKRQKESRGL